METDKLHKEIDLIQNVINRMSHNSFLIKGWALSIVGVMLALVKDSIFTPKGSLLLSIILVFTITFWYLDAFFLKAEKKYIKLYNWIIINRPKGNYENLYDLNVTRFKVESHFKIMFSKTLWTFYSIPLLIIIGLLIYNIF